MHVKIENFVICPRTWIAVALHALHCMHCICFAFMLCIACIAYTACFILFNSLVFIYIFQMVHSPEEALEALRPYVSYSLTDADTVAEVVNLLEIVLKTACEDSEVRVCLEYRWNTFQLARINQPCWFTCTGVTRGASNMIIWHGFVWVCYKHAGASFQLFLGRGLNLFFIFQCHRTIEKLEKTALYM